MLSPVINSSFFNSGEGEMKSFMKIIRSSLLLRLVALLVMTVVIDIGSMRKSDIIEHKQNVQEQQLQELRQQQYEKGQYLIYQQGTSHGILIDSALVKQNSNLIKQMVEEIDKEPHEIALNYPIATIRLAFDVLVHDINIDNLSLQELVALADIFNYLDVPSAKLDGVTNKIKLLSQASSAKITENKALQELHPDIQKSFMVDSAVSYVKNMLMSKYENDRKKVIVNPYGFVLSVALISDGKKIISGHHHNINNLIMWDISNPSNITHESLAGHTNNVNSVACSADNKIMVSCSDGVENNLIVWNMSDLSNITHHVLVGHEESVLAVAISSDGKKIASSSRGKENNLILWDISDLTNVTQQVLVAHPEDVCAVTFSSDGNELASGCFGDKENLIVWNITNPNKIVIKHKLNRGEMGVRAIKFMPDDKRILVGYFVDEVFGSKEDKQKNLVLWDISNPKNITQQLLIGHPLIVYSIACSANGKKVFSCGPGDKNNLLLWDMRNLNQITYQSLVGHPWTVYSVACSSDGKKLVAGGEGKQNFILWNLWTDQEESLLDDIKNYNVDRVRLIYQLCLEASRGEIIKLKKDTEEYKLFFDLPSDMQQLLKNVLTIKVAREKSIGKAFRLKK